MKAVLKSVLVVAVVAGTGAAAFSLLPATELGRFTDPSGRYTVVVTSKWFQGSLSSFPGQSRDRIGFIRIEDKGGRSYGTLKTPMIWMADDIRWSNDGARLIGVGSWDFTTAECMPWD